MSRTCGISRGSGGIPSIFPMPLRQTSASRTAGTIMPASGGPDLLRALRTLRIPQGSRVVDLGSGKGAAAFTLAGMFADVVGVELSPVLLKIAERNLSKLGLSNVRFISADAARYTAYDDVSHVYMFNAFPVPVLASVMQHIQTALRRQPRSFTVILKFPGVPPDVFDGFSHSVIRVPLSHPFHVFVADAAQAEVQ